MPTLNLDLDFVDHPKIKRLIARTGFEGVVCLIRLWGYTGKFHKLDGCLSEYTNEEIEQFAGWSGEKGLFIKSLVDVKLLDPNKTIHDWLDHAGHLAAYRIRAQAMAKAKWDAVKNTPSNAVSNALSNATSNASSVQFTSPQFTSLQINKEQEKDAALPPSFASDLESEDKEFYYDCVEEVKKAISGWYPNLNKMRPGAMAGKAVKQLNRIIKVHPEALVWIIEYKMPIPTKAKDWYKFVNQADETMHTDGKYPNGAPRPALCHEWASEARRACPLVPRLELNK